MPDLRGRCHPKKRRVGKMNFPQEGSALRLQTSINIYLYVYTIGFQTFIACTPTLKMLHERRTPLPPPE